MTKTEGFFSEGITTENSLGIYIHIPFCASRCPYCDFYSHCDPGRAEEYVKALEHDISTLSGMSEFADASVYKRQISSVYFGGGTPSALSAEQIAALINAVKNNFTLSPLAEITLECNPSTPNYSDFVSAAAAVGVNRISLGMQSAVDGERRLLGRRATALKVKECVEQTRKAGIENISLDVMLGVPEQTEESLMQTLNFALSLNVPHISAYILKLEEGTVFYKNKNKYSFPDDDKTADMYLLMCERLKKAGMHHYEISNFCFGNSFSRHNMLYWDCKEYLGFGASAHSYCNGKRFYYERDIDSYINAPKAVFDCFGGDYQEHFMLKLRTSSGIDTEKWCRDFCLSPKKSFYSRRELFVNQGLARYENGTLRLTDRGMAVSNSIISDLLSKV